MQDPTMEQPLLEGATLAVRAVGVAVPDSDIAISGVLLTATLIALSAFFSSSEIAMFSLADHRFEVPGFRR